MVDGVEGGAEVKEDEDGESAERSMSFVIFSRAVSVLCFERKPDWIGFIEVMEIEVGLEL